MCNVHYFVILKSIHRVGSMTFSFALKAILQWIHFMSKHLGGWAGGLRNF